MGWWPTAAFNSSWFKEAYLNVQEYSEFQPCYSAEVEVAMGANIFSLSQLRYIHSLWLQLYNISEL